MNRLYLLSAKLLPAWRAVALFYHFQIPLSNSYALWVEPLVAFVAVDEQFVRVQRDFAKTHSLPLRYRRHYFSLRLKAVLTFSVSYFALV